MSRLLLAAGVLASVLAVPSPAGALDSLLCESVGDDVVSTTDPSLPLDRLRVPDAVSVVGGPARAPLLNVAASSATDVAAPTYGSVVLAVNGSTCTLQDSSSGWAAGR